MGEGYDLYSDKLMKQYNRELPSCCRGKCLILYILLGLATLYANLPSKDNMYKSGTRRGGSRTALLQVAHDLQFVLISLQAGVGGWFGRGQKIFCPLYSVL